MCEHWCAHAQAPPAHTLPRCSCPNTRMRQLSIGTHVCDGHGMRGPILTGLHATPSSRAKEDH